MHPVPFHFKWFSLLRAFSLGFVITFATILLTSWKISKLNIIRAIRGIEEPKRERILRHGSYCGRILIRFLY